MYNHTVTRLAYFPMFLVMFVGGICAGSLIGLTLGLMDRASIGILGGTFISLITGVISGLVGLLFTIAFNTLAPAIGGIPVKITSLPISSKATSTIQLPASPSHE